MFTCHVGSDLALSLKLTAALVIVVLLAACGSTPKDPKGPGGGGGGGGGELGVAVTNLKVSAPTVPAGSVVTATYTLTNVGSETTPPLRVWTFIRPDGVTRTDAGVSVDAWQFVAEMAPGESRNLGASLQVSQEEPPGEKYLWVSVESPDLKAGGVVQGGSAKVPLVVTAFEDVASWVNQMGSEEDDEGRFIVVGADGSVTIAGTTDGTMPGAVATGSGRDDVFVSKISDEGETIWLAQFGVEGVSDYLTVGGMAEDGEGNVFVAGSTSGALPGNTGAGNVDGYVAKIGADGELLWISQFGTDSYDYVTALAVAADGGVTVAGYTNGSMPGNSHAGNYDVFVARLSLAGDQEWITQFGSTDDDFAGELLIGADGAVYLNGRTYHAMPGNEYGGGTSTDTYVAKLDASGGIMWISQLGTAEHDDVSAMLLTPTGGVVIGGSTEGSLADAGSPNAGSYDSYLASYSATGELKWVHQFGTDKRDMVYDLALDADGSSIVAVGSTFGTLEGEPTSALRSAFVTKLSAAGSRVWTRQFGSGSTALAKGVHVTDTDTIIVLGENDGQMPGANRFGDDDIFVSEFSAGGERLRTRQFGSEDTEWLNGFAVGADGSIYVVGSTDGELVESSPNAGYYDAFVVKFGL